MKLKFISYLIAPFAFNFIFIRSIDIKPSNNPKNRFTYINVAIREIIRTTLPKLTPVPASEDGHIKENSNEDKKKSVLISTI